MYGKDYVTVAMLHKFSVIVVSCVHLSTTKCK